ncbi:MAG: hypothetical protein R3B72_50315 [Polyangiaceae bacterium]
MTSAPHGEVVAVGVGARAPYGLTALQVTMSVRAQKTDPRGSHMVDKNGEPMATCRLASIADNIMGLVRFVALGGPALTQAAYPWLQACRSRGREAAPLPVVIALPSKHRPGVDPSLDRRLLPGLEARANVPLDHPRSKLVFGGRGAGASAFEHALDLLQHHEAVLVGGIDSYFDPDVLEWLDDELRLHSTTTENGFIPGEGAAFLLLCRRSRSLGLAPLGQILDVASAHEPHPYGSEEPCLGAGMTQAIRRALETIGRDTRRIGWILSDVVNERHRVEELGFALARNHEAFLQEVVHDQPLLKTGDLGASSAAMLAVMAMVRFETASAPSPWALVGVHSDGPERGALVVGAP